MYYIKMILSYKFTIACIIASKHVSKSSFSCHESTTTDGQRRLSIFYDFLSIFYLLKRSLYTIF